MTFEVTVPQSSQTLAHNLVILDTNNKVHSNYTSEDAQRVYYLFPQKCIAMTSDIQASSKNCIGRKNGRPTGTPTLSRVLPW